jgi:hypothetical protein
MAIDLRAKTYCNLGTIISGSFADDYLQNSGLIKTVGNLKLQGLHTPAVGTTITFAYEKNGHLTRLPRVLRVLSSFADPYRNTTDISMGCQLTYLEQLKPPPTTFEVSIGDNIAIPPVTGATLAAWVCEQVGLVHGTFPLTNTYALNSLQPTGGYLSLLNDLLVSESYVGYLDEQEVLRFINLSAGSNYGPLLTNQEVIDVSAIGVGQLPASSVVVRYNSLRFNYSYIEDNTQNGSSTTSYLQKRNWEKQESYDLATHDIPYTVKTQNGDTQNGIYEYDYTNSTETITYYDALDRVAKRVQTTIKSLGEVNGQWVSDAIKAGGSVEYAIVPRETKITTETQYVSDNPDDYPYCNMPAVTETTTVESRYAVGGTLGITSFLHPITESLFRMGGYAVTSKQIEYYDTVVPKLQKIYDPTTREGLDAIFNTGVTQQVTETYGSPFQTQAGQQLLRKALTDLEEYCSNPNHTGYISRWGDGINELIDIATKLTLQNTDTQIVTNREFGYEARPAEQDRINNAFQKPSYSKTAVTGNKAELFWLMGSPDSKSYIEFSMPLASDDQIVGGIMYGYVKPSDAPAKALRFGRAQNALLLGNRNGINMQLPPELLPAVPFAPLYFTANGATAQYRTNANSWTFDANGLVCSTDALFWGGIKSSSDMWYPTPPASS